LADANIAGIRAGFGGREIAGKSKASAFSAKAFDKIYYWWWWCELIAGFLNP
jgi:hypothetical protein